jgi:arylsulfatase
LVIFLSDNGGCGEHIDNTPHLPPGTVDTYATVDAPWANASNTPFRRFKAFDHEGGISTPLVMRWPRMIRDGGMLCRQVGHVIDFMPTFVELAGADYPSERNGHPVAPMEGISLLPTLDGELPTDRTLFWEFQGCRAARQGKWKIVCQGNARSHVNVNVASGHEHWELYDMDADRCELCDLGGKHPDIVKRLSSMWESCFRRVTGA